MLHEIRTNRSRLLFGTGSAGGTILELSVNKSLIIGSRYDVDRKE
jgi:hypothetical protein